MKKLKIFFELFGSRLNKSNELTNPDIFLVGIKSYLSNENQKFEINSSNIFSNTSTLVNSNLSNQYNRTITASYSRLFGKLVEHLLVDIQKSMIWIIILIFQENFSKL